MINRSKIATGAFYTLLALLYLVDISLVMVLLSIDLLLQRCCYRRPCTAAKPHALYRHRVIPNLSATLFKDSSYGRSGEGGSLRYRHLCDQ